MKTDDIYIIHPQNEEQVNALIAFAKAMKIKFEKSSASNYDLQFVEKIKLSKSQHVEGKSKVIRTEDLWK